MNIIDFRFRPNTPEIIDGIRNSNMFRAACKAIGFDARQPQPLDEIVEDLDRMGVELGVITGRDSETTYGSPSNNGSVLSFCRAYPNKFVGFWGIDPHKGMGRRAGNCPGRGGTGHERGCRRPVPGPYSRQ